MEMKPGYRPSEVGAIPTDWNTRPCSAISELITVGIVVRPTQYYAKQGVPALRSANIREDGIDDQDMVFISEKANVLLSKSQVRTGDVLTVRTGYPGTSAVVSQRFAGSNCIDILITRPSKTVNSQYLSAWINSPLGKYQVLRNQGGLAQQHFNVGNLRNLVVALPPTLREQEAIAEALSDADALIESLEQHLVKKRQLKQGAMQELLTGKKRLPRFSGKWQVKRLGTVLRFQVGFPFSSMLFNEEGRGIRLVKNRDLKGDDQVIYYYGKFDQEFLVQDGDVLVGMDGDFLPCLWAKGTALLNQRVGRIVPLAGLDRLFAFYYLAEPLKEIENTTSSTTVKHLSHGDVEGIEKALPTIDEQTAIASILFDMDAEIAALEAKLAKARQLKQGMMQELLTGRIRLVRPSESRHNSQC